MDLHHTKNGTQDHNRVATVALCEGRHTSRVLSSFLAFSLQTIIALLNFFLRHVVLSAQCNHQLPTPVNAFLLSVWIWGPLVLNHLGINWYLLIGINMLLPHVSTKISSLPGRKYTCWLWFRPKSWEDFYPSALYTVTFNGGAWANDTYILQRRI